MSFNASSSSYTSNASEGLVKLPKNFGWIGLGAMGFPMALQLVKNISVATIFIYDVDGDAMDRFVGAALKIQGGKVMVIKTKCAKEVAEKSVSWIGHSISIQILTLNIQECIITIVPEGNFQRVTTDNSI